ncbi:MAG: histidine phosphatase family protein [Cytophagales bacterium]|nr:histidine phosphatase family protein [Cytophagales bacterium]
MQNIYLITHCEATHSVEKKVGGWYDSELTEHGRKQAEELEKIINERVDINSLEIFSSDLKRAVQTAKIIRKEVHKIRLDPRLREMSFGTHEGLPQGQHLQSMVPVSPDGNRLDHRICPGAESRREVATRIDEFVEELINSGDDALIVTHGFAATFFIAAFQKIEVNSQGYLNYALNPGSLTLLKIDELFENRTVAWIKN